MNLLAFDTSTETLSVAVGAGAAVLEHVEAGGPKASARLIPVIEDLLARSGLTLAGLDAIAFGRGPGSFTGLRTAAAVAQGLGFGSGVAVLPVDTLLAVAEEAHHRSGATRIVAMLDARMGEVYHAAYERNGADWRTCSMPALARPQEVQIPTGWTLAGNVLEVLAGRLPPAAQYVAALPAAAALLRLAPAGLSGQAAHPAAQALPLYIRDKVAQTTEERAADRARKESRHASDAAEPT
ncbi:MAG: tRNA ((37)-N6)-threonylcarbamoyltransferase complex dimerization subunit type 1 TsaB [Ramlibacter sp.]|nr:tRNA ((37)-N6)-threonylcarbamoyltransferase complex dimerization subunit type 1 TsaB [Ramlibacter sp.]